MALWKLCATVLGGVLSSTMGYAISIDMNLIAHIHRRTTTKNLGGV